MTSHTPEGLVERLNNDPAFTSAAQWADLQVSIVGLLPDPPVITLHVARGAVALATKPHGVGVNLDAPEGWRVAAKHGGLQRGFRHGYLRLTGDRVGAMRNWLTLARLVDVIAREAVKNSALR